jgi:hypothetical protein
MKQIITIFSLFFCLSSKAQKKDTTIQILMPIEQFKGLLNVIDMNIDSKKTSKEITDFLIKSAIILPKVDSVSKKK